MNDLGPRSGFRPRRFVRNLFFQASAFVDAFSHFNKVDGWAIASHIALSTLTSLFPFLIVVTALAGALGSRTLADEAGKLLLETWPAEVAAPIAREIHRVATTTQSGALTVGLVLSLYFSSSGIESLRIGLNRAYEAPETRSWWMLRLESIAYVVLSAIAILTLAIFIVFGPLLVQAAMGFIPWFRDTTVVTITRFALATGVLVTTLFLVHYWLPAGHRTLRDIVPGVIVTLILWLVSSVAFARYLLSFSSQYVLTYAGLASVMITLIFLYFSAAIFLYGGEINAAILRYRRSAPNETPGEKQSDRNFTAY